MGYYSKRAEEKHPKRLDNQKRRVWRGVSMPKGESAGEENSSDNDGGSDRWTPESRLSDEDENEGLDNSPLRAKARHAAQELMQTSIRRVGSL
jgi:hypothetical protein